MVVVYTCVAVGREALVYVQPWKCVWLFFRAIKPSTRVFVMCSFWLCLSLLLLLFSESSRWKKKLELPSSEHVNYTDRSVARDPASLEVHV